MDKIEPKCVDHATKLAVIAEQLKHIKADLEELKILSREGFEFRGKVKVIGWLLAAAWGGIIGLVGIIFSK